MTEAEKERERIINLINSYAATWKKPTSFNFRNELFKLADLIKGTK